jgi:hypothetical protein
MLSLLTQILCVRSCLLIIAAAKLDTDTRRRIKKSESSRVYSQVSDIFPPIVKRLTGMDWTTANSEGHILEVLVLAAARGVPWEKICELAKPYKIMPEEIESELVRRYPHNGKHTPCSCINCARDRGELYFQVYDARVAAIPHSVTSPCACKQCDSVIRQVRSEISEQFGVASEESERRMEAIPHTDTSPCACHTCHLCVFLIHESIQKQLEEEHALAGEGLF